MLDIKGYEEKKDKGLVTLSKMGDAFAIAYRKFNPETGEEIAPIVVGVDFAEVNARKDVLQQQLDDI